MYIMVLSIVVVQVKVIHGSFELFIKGQLSDALQEHILD